MKHQFLATMAVLLTWPLALYGEKDQAQELGNYLGQHHYGRVDTENTQENLQFIEAQVSGKKVRLEIDTGAVNTCLTATCARSLNLIVNDAGHGTWGVGGQFRGDIGKAAITSWKLNGYEINRTNFIEVLPPGAKPGRCDGLFGLDYLRLNAVILPVGARFLLFKPGNTEIPSIDSYMTAMNFKAIPLHYINGGLRSDGQLNGQPFTALVDCGAIYSIFDLDYVHKVNGGQVLPSQVMMQGLDGAQQKCNLFVPNHLVLGGLKLDRTETITGQAPSFAHEGFNALLGYDVLAAHKAILDLGHNVLWMK